MTEYQYETCCVDSHGPWIQAMLDHESNEEVDYETMLAHCEGLLSWAEGAGYSLDEDEGMTLEQEPYASYHRSVYRGRPCYYMVHSAIEYVWTLQ